MQGFGVQKQGQLPQQQQREQDTDTAQQQFINSMLAKRGKSAQQPNGMQAPNPLDLSIQQTPTQSSRQS